MGHFRLIAITFLHPKARLPFHPKSSSPLDGSSERGTPAHLYCRGLCRLYANRANVPVGLGNQAGGSLGMGADLRHEPAAAMPIGAFRYCGIMRLGRRADRREPPALLRCPD